MCCLIAKNNYYIHMEGNYFEVLLHDRSKNSNPIRGIISSRGCWECTSNATDKDGYNRIRVNGKDTRTHRLIFESLIGEIPKGHCVRHKCDNPRCINPEHLETGTMADNIRDKLTRGRIGNTTKRMTSAEKKYIHESTKTVEALASELNTTTATIRRWKHRKFPDAKSRRADSKGSVKIEHHKTKQASK
jgi:hypothetical protein